MKKSIYGGCFGAFCLKEGKQYHHESIPVTTVTAESIEATREFFLEQAKLIYPTSEGWYSHYAGLAEVIEFQLQDFLESLRGSN